MTQENKSRLIKFLWNLASAVLAAIGTALGVSCAVAWCRGWCPEIEKFKNWNIEKLKRARSAEEISDAPCLFCVLTTYTGWCDWTRRYMPSDAWWGRSSRARGLPCWVSCGCISTSWACASLQGDDARVRGGSHWRMSISRRIWIAMIHLFSYTVFLLSAIDVNTGAKLRRFSIKDTIQRGKKGEEC